MSSTTGSKIKFKDGFRKFGKAIGIKDTQADQQNLTGDHVPTTRPPIYEAHHTIEDSQHVAASTFDKSGNALLNFGGNNVSPPHPMNSVNSQSSPPRSMSSPTAGPVVLARKPQDRSSMVNLSQTPSEGNTSRPRTGSPVLANGLARKSENSRPSRPHQANSQSNSKLLPSLPPGESMVTDLTQVAGQIGQQFHEDTHKETVHNDHKNASDRLDRSSDSGSIGTEIAIQTDLPLQGTNHDVLPNENETSRLAQEAEDLNEQVKELKNDVQRLNGDKSRLNAENARLFPLRGQNQSLKAELEDLKRDKTSCEVMKNRIKTLNNQLQEFRSDADSLKADNEALRDNNIQLEEAKSHLSSQLGLFNRIAQDRDAFRTANENLERRAVHLEQLLEQQKLDNAEVEHLRKESIRLNSRARTYQGLEGEITRQKTEIESFRVTLAGKDNAFNKMRAAADARLKSYYADIEALKQQVVQLQRDNSQLLEDKHQLALDGDLTHKNYLFSQKERKKLEAALSIAERRVNDAEIESSGHSSKLNLLKQQYESKIEKLEDRYEKEKEQFIDQKQREMSTRELAHQQSLKQANQSLQDTITELRSDITSLTSDHTIKVGQLEADLSAADRLHDVDLGKQQAMFDEKLSEHQAEYQAKIKVLEQGRENHRLEVIAEYKDKLKEHKRVHDEEVTRLKQLHLQETRELRKENEDFSTSLLQKDDFDPMPDNEIKKKFGDLAQAVSDLAFIDWKDRQKLWKPDILADFASNTALLRHAITQDIIWGSLHRFIFRSPFRMLGDEGRSLEKRWLAACKDSRLFYTRNMHSVSNQRSDRE